MNEVVWENTVDQGVWLVRVVRTAPYQGLLSVIKVGGEVVHEEPVGISYDAPFGPDVADLGQWMDRAIEVIDAQ